MVTHRLGNAPRMSMLSGSWASGARAIRSSPPRSTMRFGNHWMRLCHLRSELMLSPEHARADLKLMKNAQYYMLWTMDTPVQ
eukprot:3513315-Pyramimonas_sp.AAC.1